LISEVEFDGFEGAAAAEDFNRRPRIPQASDGEGRYGNASRLAGKAKGLGRKLLADVETVQFGSFPLNPCPILLRCRPLLDLIGSLSHATLP
jgi:hypothetical protein